MTRLKKLKKKLEDISLEIEKLVDEKESLEDSSPGTREYQKYFMLVRCEVKSKQKLIKKFNRVLK
ncbi:hypothetical protein [Sulfurimonas sp.]|uniref:hypothetical protein n=1 Tax=Sulfurimonas sp. TaxID=2022749 RepID=UPI002B490DB9|nr:hypothetical protein [Sulfurimonas sp.]